MEYSGQALVFASSTTANSASVPLQAVITDKADGFRGEIKYATVDFLNMATKTVLCSVKYVDAGTAGKQFLVDSSTATSRKRCVHGAKVPSEKKPSARN